MSTHSETDSIDHDVSNGTLRAVFMGTPAFAVPVLDAIYEGPGLELVAVYTPPDRKRGRGRNLEASPVKQQAEELGVPVEQPRTFRDDEAVAGLAACKPDVIVVAAYGRLLPPETLSIPRFGCLNLHPSLLPKYRGPAPVAGAILAGDSITGVSLMLLDEGMDTGPIIAQRERPIGESDDAAMLTETLFVDGAELLMEVLGEWAGGTLSASAQNDELATFTSKLERVDGLADWDLSAEVLARRQRAYAPWPGLYTTWDGDELKLLEVRPVSGGDVQPGQVTAVAGTDIAVGTGTGLLAVQRLQLAGRRATNAEEFLRGYPEFRGARLG